MAYLVCFLLGIVLVCIGACIISSIQSSARRTIRTQVDELIEGKRHASLGEVSGLIDELSRWSGCEDKRRIQKLRELLWRGPL